jgi:hypothetical protein
MKDVSTVNSDIWRNTETFRFQMNISYTPYAKDVQLLLVPTTLFAALDIRIYI